MRRLVLVLAAVLAVQLLFAWTNCFEDLFADPEVENPVRDIMARGTRRAWIEPAASTLRLGETRVVRFRFTCADTSFGDRIFGFVLAGTDSGVWMDEGRFEAATPRMRLELTHAPDSDPVARGWTVHGLAPGDSVQWAVVLSAAAVPGVPERYRAERGGPVAGSFMLRFGMDADASEPPESGVMEERIIAVR